MTAFARRDHQADWGTLTVEMRSVNHRYLEFTPRLADEFRVLEPKLRDMAGRYLRRGKVECNLRFKRTFTEAGQLSINKEFASQLAQTSREVDHLLYNPSPISSIDIMRWPGVMEMAELDWETVQTDTLAFMETLFEELVETRAREGSKLRALIEQRLDGIAPIVADVRERMPEIIQQFRERLRERLGDLQENLDAERLEQEVAILAQKSDVAEELDRLEAHVTEVHRTLEQPEAVGRRLDFLMQELNREANTLGSKSVDTRTTTAAVELKVLIEQMREQVQNIE
jgi:uncharacterized protein (TIGR00255 family)